jgi:hypothetical protein
MQVYNIPSEIVNDWICESFNPILDINGKYVVAVDADYSEHSFNDELIKFEIIKYVPPIIEQP